MTLTQALLGLLGSVFVTMSLYFVGSTLMSALYITAWFIYWFAIVASSVVGILITLSSLIILGFWLWPGELDVTHIEPEAHDEFA